MDFIILPFFRPHSSRKNKLQQTLGFYLLVGTTSLLRWILFLICYQQKTRKILFEENPTLSKLLNVQSTFKPKHTLVFHLQS